MAKETNDEYTVRVSKEYYDAPYKSTSGGNVENQKANALNYIAAHMGRISASLVRIEERLAGLEEMQKKIG